MKIVAAILLFLFGMLFAVIGFYHLMAVMFAGSLGIILISLVKSVRDKRTFFTECALGVALQLGAYGFLASSASKVGALTLYLLLTQWIGYACLLVILMMRYRYLLFKIGKRPRFHFLKIFIMVLVTSNLLIVASVYV